MLDIIYTIVGLFTVTLACVYLIFIVVTSMKKEYITKNNYKYRIGFSAVLCFLFVLQTVFAIALSKSGFTIGSDIFCALLWALNIFLGVSGLQRAVDDETPSIEIHVVITPYFDDDEEDTEGEETNLSEETENK